MAKNLSELFGKIDWDAYHNKDSKYVIDGTVYTLQKLVDIACDAILKSNTEQHTTADKYARDAYARLQMHKQNEAEAQQMHKEFIDSVCEYSTPVENSVEDQTALEHHKICDYLNTLYINKNHDYGDSVHKSFVELGFVSMVTRIYDKMQRVVTMLTKDAKVHDEKLEDTLLDMANYCVIAVLELRKRDKDGSVINRPRVPEPFPPMPREHTERTGDIKPGVHSGTAQGNRRV